MVPISRDALASHSEGAFSPDQRVLAVAMTTNYQKGLVFIFDMRTGRGHVLRGSSGADSLAIDWNPSGSWLFFERSAGGVGGWHRGQRTAVRIPE